MAEETKNPLTDRRLSEADCRLLKTLLMAHDAMSSKLEAQRRRYDALVFDQRQELRKHEKRYEQVALQLAAWCERAQGVVNVEIDHLETEGDIDGADQDVHLALESWLDELADTAEELRKTDWMAPLPDPKLVIDLPRPVIRMALDIGDNPD